MKNRGQPSRPVQFPTRKEKHDVALYFRCCRITLQVIAEQTDAKGYWYKTEVITPSNDPGEIFDLYEDAKEFFQDLQSTHLIVNCVKDNDPDSWAITNLGRGILDLLTKGSTDA